MNNSAAFVFVDVNAFDHGGAAVTAEALRALGLISALEFLGVDSELVRVQTALGVDDVSGVAATRGAIGARHVAAFMEPRAPAPAIVCSASLANAFSATLHSPILVDADWSALVDVMFGSSPLKRACQVRLRTRLAYTATVADALLTPTAGSSELVLGMRAALSSKHRPCTVFDVAFGRIEPARERNDDPNRTVIVSHPAPPSSRHGWLRTLERLPHLPEVIHALSFDPALQPDRFTGAWGRWVTRNEVEPLRAPTIESRVTQFASAGLGVNLFDATPARTRFADIDTALLLGAGTPVVYPQAGPLASAIGAAGAGWIVDPDDERQVADALDAAGDARERADRGRAATALAAELYGAGRAGEQLGRALEATRAKKPVRKTRAFVHVAGAATAEELFDYYAATPTCHQTLVSVVVPTWNRAHVLPAALESVLAQSHRRIEVLVMDDGSDDDTAEVVAALNDDRIVYQRSERLGVSHARNRGLNLARGQIIAYLDSDNRWLPRYLEGMVAAMDRDQLDCGYAAMECVDPATGDHYFRASPFDWEACAEANYIDMNVFCHRRELADSHGGFDETLRRMVDWDLILRYTRHSRTQLVPFIGCEYRVDEGDRSRISRSEPLLYADIVRLKNNTDQGVLSPEEISAQLRMPIEIKIAAPRAKREQWGDYHYAVSLKEALERLGHSVSIVFHKGRGRPNAKVRITLRGLDRMKRRAGQISVLWSISHPELLRFNEVDAADLVYVASESYARFLGTAAKRSVEFLPQATDAHRFEKRGNRLAGAADVAVFVGNSRKTDRPIVRWASESAAELAVYGNDWEGRLDASTLRGTNIDNGEDLTALYRSAKVVLNDHWDSMREFGYISNRVFDVLGAGGRVVSDRVGGMSTLFGELVPTADDVQSLEMSIDRSARLPADQIHALRQHIRESHTFDARARRITDDILVFSGLPARFTDKPDFDSSKAAPWSVSAPRRRLVGLVRQGGAGPQSSAFIRLLAPLTHPTSHERIEFSLHTDPAEVPLGAADALIIQRAPFDDPRDAQAFVAAARASDVPIVFDQDDALHAMDADHPERDLYAPLRSVVETVQRAADLSWYSTETLAGYYEAMRTGPYEVVANGLDDRVWRSFRYADNRRPPEVPALLYMGTATHDADLAMILPALDALAAERSFTLTLIGASRQPPVRPWLTVRAIPRGVGSYPRFVRWLRQQAPFTVGLAPLVDNDFNAAKSDIKILDYLALGAIPVVSKVVAYNSWTDSGMVRLTENTVAGWTRALRDAINEAGTPATWTTSAGERKAHVWATRSSSHMAAQQLPSLERMLAHADQRKSTHAQ